MEIIRVRRDIKYKYSIHKFSQQVCRSPGSLYNNYRNVVLNSQFDVLDGGQISLYQNYHQGILLCILEKKNIIRIHVTSLKLSPRDEENIYSPCSVLFTLIN